MDNKTISTVEEYNQRGKVLYSVGNYLEAIEMYKKAEAEDPMYVETYFNMGEAYVMLDKYEEAKEAFSKVLLIDKQNGVTYFHLGNVEFLLGNNDAGREYYAKAINNGFDDAQLYFNLGTVFEDLGNYEEAIKSYNKAIAKDKFRADAKLRKAQIYINTNRHGEAIQALDSMIELNPDIFEGHHYKILLLIEQNNYAEAEKALNKALKLFPEDEGFIFDKVLLLERQEKYDEALDILQKEFSDNTIREVLLEKAKILLAQNKIDESIGLFESVRANEGDEFDDETRFYLINIYAYRNQHEKAMEYCKEIIENGKENNYYYSAVFFNAECLNKLGKEMEARHAYEAAASLFRIAGSSNPGMLDIIVYRALCYKALKQYDKAFDMVNYLLAINEDLGEAYLIRAELYKEINEFEKAEMDRATAASKSKMLQMLLQ